MLKSIPKVDQNSADEHFHDTMAETTKVNQMDSHQERRIEGEDSYDLIASIDALIAEVESNMSDPNKSTSSSESDENDWETKREALFEQIDLEYDINFLIENFPKAHQEILDDNNKMSKLLEEIKKDKQQQSAEFSDVHGAKYPEVNTDPPQGNISEDKEEQEVFEYTNKSFIAEPHNKTHKSELLSEEKLQNLNLEECLNHLKWFEAELQQEKSKNKAVQEELEQVELSFVEEIQKHKTELDDVRQQLKSLQRDDAAYEEQRQHHEDELRDFKQKYEILQRDHKKTTKEHADLHQQELKTTKAAYEEQLKNHKDELRDFKQKYEILQRDLKKALETIERQQSSGKAPLEQEDQSCKEDLRQKFDSFRADLKKSKLGLQSSESIVFTRGLGSMAMPSNQGMLQSFKNAEKNFRSRVLSLQSELQESRIETQQERKLCDRLQKEKDDIRLAYMKQQNQLSYKIMHLDSVRAQLDNYKTRIESNTEETDLLRKAQKKDKKSHKDHEKTCKNKARTESEQKASDHEDLQTSQQTQKTKKKSVFTKMRHFLGLRKHKKKEAEQTG